MARSEAVGLAGEYAWACGACLAKEVFRFPPEGWEGTLDRSPLRDPYESGSVEACTDAGFRVQERRPVPTRFAGVARIACCTFSSRENPTENPITRVRSAAANTRVVPAESALARSRA